MKRITGVVLALALITTLLTGTAAAAGPYCGHWWGSLPKAVTDMSAGEVIDVRAGRHACFDRLVVDVDGDVAGYRVEYVTAVHQQGSGAVVPVRGEARLQVMVTAAATPTDAIFRPDGQLIDVSGYRTFRQVAWAGSYEGQTTLGLGVRARLPFRVLVLDGPGDRSRLVVDVAHRW